MGFREQLEGICERVEGTFAASLMGFDGIAIDTVQPVAPEGIELQTLLIEYSGIISSIKNSAEQLQMGAATEVSIRTDKLVAIARLLTPDYFMVVAMAPDGNVGRARYELRVTGPKVVLEL